MSISRTILGVFATLALVFSVVPALALASTGSYFNYDYCNTYPTYNYGSNNYQYNNCPHGTLLVYVQVNPTYNPSDRKAQDFSVSVNGTQVSKPSFPGSSQGTSVYLNNGSYTVTVAPFQGYTPSYSVGCTGSVNNGSQATCIITMNPSTPYPYPQYQPQYPYYAPGYNTPTVYVTPTYVPKLPNTGFDPNSGIQMLALMMLVATALFSLPYVRKTLASILG